MDDNEIIYIALSNNILGYNELIKNGIDDPEAENLARYIINRSLELLDTYGDKINRKDKNTPIKKPKWR